jgi:cation diffusion facilitator CzcD-associated flavoprotein CzcO
MAVIVVGAGISGLAARTALGDEVDADLTR